MQFNELGGCDFIKNQGFYAAARAIGVNMSKSELDQPRLIKLVAKALRIAGNFVTVSHGEFFAHSVF